MLTPDPLKIHFVYDRNTKRSISTSARADKMKQVLKTE
jgi:hypothetical protein